MTAHRYWRIRCPDTQIAGEYLGITELEMRATAAGADQTAGKTATASANAGAPYVPGNAIDNNAATFWTTGAVAPPAGGHWIRIDFGLGGAVNVEEISIKVRPDAFREDPAELVLEWSDDGAAFTEYMHVYLIPVWTAGETRIFTVATANPPSIKISKATLHVASSDEGDHLYISKATLHVVSKVPSMITVTKATLHVASQHPQGRGMSLM